VRRRWRSQRFGLSPLGGCSECGEDHLSGSGSWEINGGSLVFTHESQTGDEGWVSLCENAEYSELETPLETGSISESRPWDG
jgi:hypothetical protein